MNNERLNIVDLQRVLAPTHPPQARRNPKPHRLPLHTPVKRRIHNTLCASLPRLPDLWDPPHRYRCSFRHCTGTLARAAIFPDASGWDYVRGWRAGTISCDHWRETGCEAEA